MEKNVYAKKSKLPDAGLGLFAKKNFKKGDKIVEYKGRIQTWKEAVKENWENPYLFWINAKTVINPIKSNTAMAHYANDARGPGKVKGLRNNAEYQTEGNRCFIFATRDIKRYEEIFVDYGDEYWPAIKSQHASREKK
jgi:SET domain-containing protein